MRPFDVKPCIHCGDEISMPLGYDKPAECANCVMKNLTASPELPSGSCRSTPCGSESQWVLCADRLPEVDTEVLAYYYESGRTPEDEPMIEGIEIMKCYHDDDENGYCFGNKTGFLGGGEVKAWMPLPDKPIVL